MSLALFLALVAPAVLVPVLGSPAGRFLADRLRPSWSAWLFAGTLAGFAAVTVFGLGLLMGVGLMRWDPNLVTETWSLAAWVAGSRPALGSSLLGRALAVGSALVAVVLLVRLARVARGIAEQYRVARALVPPEAERGSVIEVPGVDAAARALPVRGGHVLVEASTWSALPPRQRDVVLAHERSHLRHRHDVHLAVAALAVACNPLLAPLSRALGYAVERWADEDATAMTDRRTVARTVGAVALAGSAPIAPVLAVGGGVVPRRVAALMAPGPRTSTWGGAVLGLVVATVLASSAGLAHHAWVDLMEILATR